MSFQTKIDEVGRVESSNAEDCKICSVKNKGIYVVEQNYFVLFYLPVFPTGRNVYKICSACKARLKVKPNDPNIDWVNRTIPRKQKFTYYWGWLVFAGLAYLAYRFLVSIEIIG